MDGDVDAAVQQRLFDLAGEQALAADVLQRAVEDLVAGDLDHHDLERRFGQVEGGHQAGAASHAPATARAASHGFRSSGAGGGGQVIVMRQGLMPPVPGLTTALTSRPAVSRGMGKRQEDR
jgi:hypothetical protein